MERFCGVHALCIRWLAEIFIAFSNVRYRRCCHCGKSTCSRSRFFFFFLSPFLSLSLSIFGRMDIQLLAIVALSKVFDAAFFFFFWKGLFRERILYFIQDSFFSFLFNFVVLVATLINRPCVRSMDLDHGQGFPSIFYIFFLKEEKKCNISSSLFYI